MRLRIAAPESPTLSYQFLATYLVDDVVALDAGCLGLLPLEIQRGIQHVFLSHSHLDHIASLALFLDNVYQPGPQCPTVYAFSDTWEVLSQSIFNDRVWPDLVRLSREESAFVRFQELKPGVAISAAGVQVTPLPLEHVVPTCGFLIEDGAASAAVVSDTGPTDEVWNILNRATNLQALFLEASFPTRMQWLADKTLHLTPRTFAAERAKLSQPTPTHVVHIKPAFFAEVAAEIRDLGIANVARTEFDYECI